MKQTRKPFPQALDELLREQEVSQRELARRTKKHKGWGHSTTISFLISGKLPPTAEAIEVIGQALQVRPEFFPEYRMAKMREQLNPVKVGFPKALRTLERLEK